MIKESWFWKRELIDQLGQLDTWSARQAEDCHKDNWGGEAYFRLERSIFYTALTIRRLLESYKVSDVLERSSFQLTVFGSKNDGPSKLTHFMGSNDIITEYDFDSPELEMFNPKKLVSEIIHSSTLEMYVNDAENNMDGFFVASEKNNYNRLVDVPMTRWKQFVGQFIDDEVSELSVKWGEGDKKLIVYKEHGKK